MHGKWDKDGCMSENGNEVFHLDQDVQFLIPTIYSNSRAVIYYKIMCEI